MFAQSATFVEMFNSIGDLGLNVEGISNMLMDMQHIHTVEFEFSRPHPLPKIKGTFIRNIPLGVPLRDCQETHFIATDSKEMIDGKWVEAEKFVEFDFPETEFYMHSKPNNPNRIWFINKKDSKVNCMFTAITDEHQN